MHKLKKPLIIVVLLVVAGGIGFLLFQFFQGGLIRAEDIAPHAVEAADLTENSTAITWTTDKESQGVVQYGTSADSLTFFAPETQKSTTHSVPLTLLAENMTYYFTLKIGDKIFDNAGVPWSFTTKSKSGRTGQSIIPTMAPVADPYLSCTQETDCDVIKEKIQSSQCLAIHYSQCLMKQTSEEEVIE